MRLLGKKTLWQQGDDYLCRMNFLAHAYLSFDRENILLGNMISDFVKGKKKFDYPPAIQEGIMLHREIDRFTDTHEATRRARQFFRGAYGLYAGAFVDILYDHFLARDAIEFPHPGDLLAFSQKTYEQLSLHTEIFPERFAGIFFHMRKDNWLYNYQFLDGIGRSFAGMVRRSAHLTDHHEALRILEKNYEALGREYERFFPEVKAHTRQFLAGIA